MQRSRLLSAAAIAVAELGWPGASVAHITARARVSRRTFYDLFDNREDCLLAILEDVFARVEDELAAASLDGLPWRERVRAGLWTILSFLDRERLLARVCVSQALQGGPRVLARREEILTRLESELDRGREEQAARAPACPALTAEGLVGATFAIVHARIAPPLSSSAGVQGTDGSIAQGSRHTASTNGNGRRPVIRAHRAQPLACLLGELMEMIVLPYLGPAAARRERERPAPLAAATGGENGEAAAVDDDPLAGVPMRLTYRTARVLAVIAANPGVSNRHAGELAGVSDQGQISKLLARLERLGLTETSGDGHSRGEPNAWELTSTGRRVARSLSTHTHDREEAMSQ
jgi:AcrR family transcriptional regulator